MSNNLMPEVAKLLGVELGEEFIIENEYLKETVVLNMDGLTIIRPNDEEWGKSRTLLVKVLQGLYEVVKLPWEPKYEEQFYTYIHNEAHNEWLVDWFYWYGTPAQLAIKQLGMAFKTREDAEKALPEFYEKLTGKPLSSLE